MSRAGVIESLPYLNNDIHISEIGLSSTGARTRYKLQVVQNTERK